MVKLTAKGSNQFVGLSKVPTEMAESETRIVFSAYRSACESLLQMASTEEKSQAMNEATLAQYVALRHLYEEMEQDMKHLELMMAVIDQKVMGF